MKFRFSLFILSLFILVKLNAQTKGTFVDLRDNKTYKTLSIGTQTWFAQNLAFKVTEGCWSYNNDSNNVSKFGYLYNYNTALNICPEGWHLPTNQEWNVLINQVGGENKSYKALKKNGFNLLLGGYRSTDGNYSNMNEVGNWWSSTLLMEKHAWHRYANKYSKKMVMGSSFPTDCGFNVRCVKN